MGMFVCVRAGLVLILLFTLV